MASAFWFMSHLKGLRLTAKQYADLRQSMMKDRARTRGAKRSEEFKKRCSEYSKEREQKHREQGFQINFSKEVLKILSENGKELAQGNSLEGPQRERFLAAIRSEKVSQKKSEAFLKRKEAGMKREYIPQSEERIQHRAEKNRGQKRSEETKERMRQAAIEREKRKKEKKAASKEE